MSSRNSALASLTATYTDSENEEDRRTDEESESEGASTVSQVRSRQQTPLRETSESSGTPSAQTNNTKSVEGTGRSDTETSKPKRRKALRLVSYIDDTIVSDDENNSPTRHEAEVVDQSEEEPAAEETPTPQKPDRSKQYGFSLPPEPKGKCPPELQDKIAALYERMKNSTMDTNRIIQERKEFRNPSIYEKLIHFCDINELGTNYPPEFFDPFKWGKESYYEELAKAQMIEMEKVEKARKEATKTEIQTGVKRMEPEESKKRKSKWDQPGVLGAAPGMLGAAVPVTVVNVLKPAGIIQPTLTTTATGTKGTVISAFGSLPKKPKV
ncbi:SAP30-binding protein [Anopheles bellator]|uniref:SAP30-binding protein n=1 Tax=Anopheles bellator TaxID=139047 RepID=UPI00264797B1|nr:SAP30-binding protein [Anopheles bellator]